MPPHLGAGTLLCLFALAVAAAAVSVPAAELAALNALYEATNGPTWADSRGWNDGDACAAVGVTCSTNVTAGTAHVVAIELSGNKLSGTLPASGWDLPELRILDLSDNLIGGTVPVSWGESLQALEELNLGGERLLSLAAHEGLGPNYRYFTSIKVYSSNPLTGTLPPEWGKLSKLVMLSLATGGTAQGAGFVGSIPDEWIGMRSLVYINIAHSGLGGDVLAPVLARINGLRYVNARFCGFKSIPREFVGSTISQLELTGNPMSGFEFPTWLSEWSALEEFALNICNITGTLPASLGEMTQLTRVVIGSAPHLHGVISPTWGNLVNMRGLFIYQIGLTGTIPPELGAWTKIERLVLAETGLTGTIPPELGQMSAASYVLLNRNKLSGTLPRELEHMTALADLAVHSNNLSGTIPPSWGTNMVNLVNLRAFDNSLSGTLPPGFPALEIVDVHNNNLQGHLDILCNKAKLGIVDVSSNGLSSFPDCKTCIGEVDISNNAFVGQLPTMEHVSCLTKLSASHNMFSSSSLPSSWSRLNTTLAHLDLSYNNLAGAVSNYLIRIKYGNSLGYIDLSHNKLSGQIQQTVFSHVDASFLQGLVRLYVNDNNIVGSVPGLLERLPLLHEVDLSNNNFTGSASPMTEDAIANADLRGNPGLREPDGISLPVNVIAHYPLVQPSVELNYRCPTLTDTVTQRVRLDLDAHYYGASLCECLPGYHGSNGDCLSCTHLGPAVTCEGGQVVLNQRGLGLYDVYAANVTINPNYFRVGTAPSGDPLIDPCYRLSSDETSCNPAGAHPAVCAVGYEDRLCSRCSAGYFPQGRRCRKCPRILPELMAVAYSVSFCVWYAINQTGRRSAVLTPLVKSLFIFMQTSALIFARSSAFFWPSSILSFFSISFGWTAVSTNVLTCLVSSTAAWETSFVFSTLIVPGLGLFCLLAYGLLASISRCTRSGLLGKDEQHWRYGGIRSMLAILNLMYMPITVGMLIVLPCESSADGRKYLWAAPWIECSSSNTTWVNLVVVGSVFSALYGLGVPVMFLAMMRARSKTLERLAAAGLVEVDGHWLQWFYAGYRPGAAWYEFVIMGRRLAIAVVAVIPSSSPIVPLGFFMTLVVALFMHIYRQPFLYQPLNRLELLTLVQLFLTFVIGQIFSSRTHESSLPSSSIYLEATVVVSNAGVVILYLIAIVVAVKRRVRARKSHGKARRADELPLCEAPALSAPIKIPPLPLQTILKPAPLVLPPLRVPGPTPSLETIIDVDSYSSSGWYTATGSEEEEQAECYEPEPPALEAEIRAFVRAHSAGDETDEALVASLLAVWNAPK
ncbi:leucine Rich Repeat family protein [Thecamonas trahens ATCC 50062]|uniref:Leucine Rich Repeat family protein n=1 Tax=Thecamonas trahens ATCC 50062 TaxID=461836 RepID=A0A0L0D714_THETB|nr:leucine Rich Repeat family protein [Thecamonas trahens ATCC 50062]KNC47068.1 leucine Rich Repeat family protein [Thecamonas trahens ATCC 50062]|eukprot:XP_013759848.1 leucine Rich Repeat family protein [Thecamonas trahens ATCC 50062]